MPYFTYSLRLPVKRVPPLSSFADEETEAPRNEGHGQLGVTEPRFRLGAAPPQGRREGGGRLLRRAATLQAHAFERVGSRRGGVKTFST